MKLIEDVLGIHFGGLWSHVTYLGCHLKPTRIQNGLDVLAHWYFLIFFFPYGEFKSFTIFYLLWTKFIMFQNYHKQNHLLYMCHKLQFVIKKYFCFFKRVKKTHLLQTVIQPIKCIFRAQYLEITVVLCPYLLNFSLGTDKSYFIACSVASIPN